jgi:hypothetical protein
VECFQDFRSSRAARRALPTSKSARISKINRAAHQLTFRTKREGNKRGVVVEVIARCRQPSPKQSHVK